MQQLKHFAGHLKLSAKSTNPSLKLHIKSITEFFFFPVELILTLFSRNN